jgi:hypothetical protein
MKTRALKQVKPSLSMRSSPRARTRGQVMVLGCVALLVMALMLMASYSVTNAIHEKIRIQSHADAQAYSVAVVEARAFNITAHYNRAIAAGLVAQMSLHSWMAIATADLETLATGFEIMMAIAGLETLLGCYPPTGVVVHCPCVAEALLDAGKFETAKWEWADKLEGLESKFNDGVADITDMVNSMHKSQKRVLKNAKDEIPSSGSVLAALKKVNAPRSEYITDFDGPNGADFACALEGSDFDGDCSGDRNRSKASMSDRSKVISSVANAARPLFDRANVGASMVDATSQFNTPSADVPKDCLTSGTWKHEFMTRTRSGEGTDSDSSAGQEAKNIGGGTYGSAGTVTGFHHIPIMVLPIGGGIYSDENGGSHSEGHSAQHDKYKGTNQGSTDPCKDTNCFVNFRGLPDAAKDFGQPTTLGGVTQDVRLFKGKGGGYGEGKNAPWALNTNMKLKIEIVKGDAATIDYTARNGGKAYALAKGKAYYHQLGNWTVAPNLFDPFWRAKLHAFERSEFKKIIDMTGDSDGQQITRDGAPIEGRE